MGYSIGLGIRIYLLRAGRKPKSYKTYANVLVQMMFFVVVVVFWHHCGVSGVSGVSGVRGSDKDEKRYVNFVGTDVKIKPFFFFFFGCVSQMWQIYDSDQIGNLFVYASCLVSDSDRIGSYRNHIGSFAVGYLKGYITIIKSCKTVFKMILASL